MKTYIKTALLISIVSSGLSNTLQAKITKEEADRRSGIKISNMNALSKSLLFRKLDELREQIAAAKSYYGESINPDNSLVPTINSLVSQHQEKAIKNLTTIKDLITDILTNLKVNTRQGVTY